MDAPVPPQPEAPGEPTGITVCAIVPVHNGSAYLEEALASIRDQTRPPDEILVVDDGSTDRSLELARTFDPRVRCVRTPESHGPAAARNRGLSLTSCDIVAFLDADDRWQVDKLSLQLEYLALEPAFAMVLGQTQLLCQRPTPHGRCDWTVLPEARLFLNLGCGLFRRSAFEALGKFDTELRYAEDHDWITRAREAGLRIGVFDDTVLYHRLHDSNLTAHRERVHADNLRMLKKSLDRRRAEGSPGELPTLERNS